MPEPSRYRGHRIRGMRFPRPASPRRRGQPAAIGSSIPGRREWPISRVRWNWCPQEPEGRKGQSVFAVLGRGGQVSDLYEATWSSMHADSIWVQLVSGGDRDVITVRAERSGSDWEGEGRVLRPGGPVSVGQARGAVRLVAIGCEAS